MTEPHVGYSKDQIAHGGAGHRPRHAAPMLSRHAGRDGALKSASRWTDGLQQPSSSSIRRAGVQCTPSTNIYATQAALPNR